MSDDRKRQDRSPGPGGPLPPGGPERPRPRAGLFFWLIMFAGAILLMYFLRSSAREAPQQFTINEWLEKLREGRIQSVVIQPERVTGAFVSNEDEHEKFAMDILEDQVGMVTTAVLDWNKKIEEGKRKGAEVEIKSKPPEETLQFILINFVPWVILLLLFWFFFIRQIRGSGGPGGVLSFGKSRAKLVGKEQTGVTFDQVAGVEEAKEELQELVEFLRSPKKFRRLGARIPRGVLLVGSPGTGKTLLAKAVAGEAGRPFFSISGSDFVEMFVGVGASRVRDLFRQAKESAPCIIFLDEIDAVGRRRGAGLGGGHDEREQTLNAILVEMDGFEREASIIVIAATNRPDVLDPALLRPGRFDRQIVVDLPDIRGREAILKVHAKKYKLSSDAELGKLARGTPSFSGADLEAIINEAALIATRAGKDAIEMEDLEEARDKVRWGRQKRSRVMDEEDRRITAYHESGHALVAALLPEVEPLHKVSIIPQGVALGMTMSLPEKDRYHVKRKEFLGNVCLLLAGRVAEEMFCDDITAGAQNDLERATEIARSMVCRWGMSDNLGPVSYSEGEDTVFLGREITRTRTHSEAMALKIDEEVRSIVVSAKARAEELLNAHRTELGRVATALLKHEVLQGEDVFRILAGQELVKEPSPEADSQTEEPEPAKPPPEEERADPGLQGPPQPAPQPEG